MFALTLSLRALSPSRPNTADHDFHVLKSARDAYGFPDAFFSTRGDVIFANHYQAHLFVSAINERRRAPDHERLRASELFAMGLIHEIFHAVIGLYRGATGAGVFASVLGELEASFGPDLDRTLGTFLERFPPPRLYRGEQTAEEFLAGTTDGVPNREWVLEELVLLWISNQNPGYAPIGELITDRALVESTAYLPIVKATEGIFQEKPPFGPEGQSLIDMLLAPIRHSPSSLSGQLHYMRTRWGVDLAGLAAWSKLLAGLDFIAEEGLWFLRKSHGVGAEDALVPQTYKGPLYEHEPERFSQDLHWMPRVVMIAKSTFVWLDQLSKRYRRPITRLCDIPDEELQTLGARGFTALWLIGLWRRSTASKTIKERMGARDVVASAYSLHDYEIAPELGGEAAYQDLRSRAERYGVRLASDMVPNHVGIDGRWVLEHPERFIQSPYPPFPNYTFDGPDLSPDPSVGLFMEDGYWKRSDAAVVFKRLDRRTGQVRYIYHGNDGTSMPWNDTAQLDYLRADVREAVMQMILHVARMFPIIRFDAAMTLAKRHFQRLWFPLPGTGGAIPSRAEHALTKERFDELFPNEFWREVVDRVAAEVPNTLLLAEAFWLMEGYFVRTLGMHRVYNSAFMNMLKREENANYRASVRNVLEFNPQILKRHVNFMNNPDEEPAIAQFGRDDKYFGVCVLLATMPGLPMFGHGQVEGLHEKYGMEFMRAQWEEQPDEHLVARHEREIFPLLRKRYLFAEVDDFFLYDFVAPEGHVDEDVFAYSNRAGGERALVIYHNRYKETAGSLHRSIGYLANGQIQQKSLVDGLGLGQTPGRYVVYRDAITQLEHIRSIDRIRERGFELQLRAFEYHAFLDLREVAHSRERPYGDLERELQGAGVPSIEDAAIALYLRAVHVPFYEAINPGSVRYLVRNALPRAPEPIASGARSEREAEGEPTALEVLVTKLDHVLAGWAYLRGGGAIAPPAGLREELPARLLGAVATLCDCAVAERTPSFAGVDPEQLYLAWMFTEAISRAYAHVEAQAGGHLEAHAEARRTAAAAWRLEVVLERAFCESGASAEDARHAAALLPILVRHRALFFPVEEAATARPEAAPLAVASKPIEHPSAAVASHHATVLRLLDDDDVRSYLEVHPWQGILWLRKERFIELVRTVALVAATEEAAAQHLTAGRELKDIVRTPFAEAEEMIAAAERAGYQLFNLRERISVLGHTHATVTRR